MTDIEINPETAPSPATTNWVPVGPGMPAVPAPSGANLTYRGNYSGSATYNDGDIVVAPDGITYLCVENSITGVTPVAWSPWSVPVPPVVNGQWLKGSGGAAVWSSITPADVVKIPYGTSLPASPYDGQEAILVDSVTAPNWQWRFRYNAGSTSYKWEFIGGDDYFSFADQNVYNALSGGTSPYPPLIYVPRAGEYEASGGAQFTSGTQGEYVSLGIGAASASSPSNAMSMPFAGGHVSISHSTAVVATPAGTQISFWITCNGTDWSIANAWFRIHPRRVS